MQCSPMTAPVSCLAREHGAAISHYSRKNHPRFADLITLDHLKPGLVLFGIILVQFEYVVAQEIFNVGVHFTDYTEDIFQVGISLIYYPMESRYFYTFLTSDWIHGEYDRERDIGTGVYKEYTETVNYWRVVLGIGAEVLFVKHFGAYVEAGFEFFAGDGSYYTNLNKEYGYLDNNKIVLPLGIGLTFPF